MVPETDMILPDKIDGFYEFVMDDQGKKLRYVRFSGENIKALRKELKLSQESVSNGIGKNRTTITNYESGELDNPSHEILCDLGEFFSSAAGYKIVFYAERAERKTEKDSD